jgi:hypothetical protein
MARFRGLPTALVVITGILAVPSLATARGPADSWRLVVRGGNADLGETPVMAEVDDGLDPGSYIVDSTVANESFPAQIFRVGAMRYLATILPHVPQGRNETYNLRWRLSQEPDLSHSVLFHAQGRGLAVQLDRRPWTSYRVDQGHKPFYFPMIGPSGDPYTRAYPMESLAGEDHDHPHQRSCWFTHGNVNGVDFWGEDPKSGTIRETDRSIIVEGPVLGRLATKDDWNSPDGRRVCRDERVVTFYRTKTDRIFDFDITLRADPGPVTFQDTKEGMFGIRVASSMDVNKKNGGKITNAEGLTDEKAWGQASRWVDYVGPVGSNTVGIAVMNHPGSFRYPTTWHVRTYGLFAANPFGWHDFGRPEKGDYTIPAGQSIRFLYRIIFHAGVTDAAALNRLFESYATPPSFSLERN